MKKNLTAAFVAALLSLSAVACGGGAEDTGTGTGDTATEGGAAGGGEATEAPTE
jgi:hypothetical protein